LFFLNIFFCLSKFNCPNSRAKL